jgi:hypothetical protein
MVVTGCAAVTGDSEGASFAVLLSTSRAQDAGYLAAHDVQVSCEAAALEYRLIGGISVTLLTWVHGVVDVVPARETADADVLAPSHRSQLVSNVAVGAQLTTGRCLDLHLPLADVVAALCLKAYAYRDRRLDRDALDIWRLLEAAHAAGVHAADWKLTGARLDAARILHDLYGRLGSAGPERATSSNGERQRIRALLTEVVARPDRAGRPS